MIKQVGTMYHIIVLGDERTVETCCCNNMKYCSYVDINIVIH